MGTSEPELAPARDKLPEREGCVAMGNRKCVMPASVAKIL